MGKAEAVLLVLILLAMLLCCIFGSLYVQAVA